MTSSSDEYEVRNATEAEFQQYHCSWAAEQQWNPGLHDHRSMYFADPNGHFLGLLNGEVVGVVSGLKYSDTYGWIGLYIVKKAYRGRSFGLRLFQHAMRYLAGCNVGLDGVVEQVPNYRRSGFADVHQMVRYRAPPRPARLPVSDRIRDARHLSDAHFRELVLLDETLSGGARPDVLRRWIDAQGTVSFVEFDEAGRVRGFAAIRPAQETFRVGPMYASSLESGGLLLDSLLAHAPSATVEVDVPQRTRGDGADRNAVFASRGFAPFWSCTRMYTRGLVGRNWDDVFGVLSLEIG